MLFGETDGVWAITTYLEKGPTKFIVDNRAQMWYPIQEIKLRSSERSAGVAELVDARDLKSCGSNPVPVRLRSPAPISRGRAAW